MANFIDADRLKAELEKRLKNTRDYMNGTGIDYKGPKYYKAQGKESAYDAILNLLDALQQEQSQVADASKMERLNVDVLHEWSMRFAPDIRDAIEATAYHFWDLAIYSRKEQPEVNLAEEITRLFSKNPIPYEHVTDWPLLKNTALHFFELGLNARKEK